MQFGAIMAVPLKIIDPLPDEFDIGTVKSQIEDILFKLKRAFRNLEAIIIGDFKEFDQRNINALYHDNKIFISNKQSSPDDMVDDIIHEFAHFIEEKFSPQIYADGKVKKEYLLKRRYFNKVFKKNYPVETGFNKKFDSILFNKIGYDQIEDEMGHLLFSPYALTSLREYFASCFEGYYLMMDQDVEQSCKETIKKIIELEGNL